MTGDQAKLVKLQISLGLNISGNILDNVSTTCNQGLDIFRRLNVEMLHTVSLTSPRLDMTDMLATQIPYKGHVCVLYLCVQW